VKLSRRGVLGVLGLATAGILLKRFRPYPLSRSAGDKSSMRSIRPSISEGRSLHPLVFIHGIKGSKLSNAKGSVQWLSGWQALGLASANLSLPLQWNGDVQQSDGLEAKAPLRTVAGLDIYAPFLDWAEASGRAFHAFAYDWRRDNLESAGKFAEFLKAVSERNGGAKVQVVAHSMGGLISFVTLNRHPELFHSVLFAGVPFGRSISFLEDMHAGVADGLNRWMLSPHVLFTFVSPYCFFPLDPTKSGLAEANGIGIVHDWYSAEDWERQKLGIFADNAQDRVTDQQREHLRNALRRAKELRLQLVCRKEDSFQYPPIAVLASDTRPTLSTVVRDGPHSVKGWDFQSAPKEAGDGRVASAEAMPPEGVPRVVHMSARQHPDLLNDTQQVAEILAQL